MIASRERKRERGNGGSIQIFGGAGRLARVVVFGLARLRSMRRDVTDCLPHVRGTRRRHGARRYG